MTHPTAHQHIRKRVHQKKEKFPHPNPHIQFLDKIIYVVGVLSPIFTLPQLYKIWIEQNAAGVSLISWSAFLIFGLVWLTYGFVHKEWPIVVTYTIWTLVQLPLVIGIILFG